MKLICVEFSLSSLAAATAADPIRASINNLPFLVVNQLQLVKSSVVKFWEGSSTITFDLPIRRPFA
jgi:hypothetical protein